MGTDFKSVPNAYATGGAFTSTKHGGNTNVDNGVWCPAPPCGVNRARGGDVVSYFGENSEAGDYQIGECAHCHEPHASFSGYEPPPNSILFNSELSSSAEAAGPDPYLLFGAFDSGASQGTYSKLCWYCHEKMSLGFPPNPGGYGYWGFYQGKTKYTASIHYNSPNFYWTGTTGDPVSIWPRQNRSALPPGNKGSCLNCHTAHGIKEGGSATAFDTSAVPTTPNKHLAANNADVSTDYLIPRQLIAWEEALCLNCHKSSGVGPDINTQLSMTTKHPVIDTALAGRHKTKEYLNVSNTGQLDGKYWNSAKAGTDTRHVECVDCHNPHVAQAIPIADKNRTGMTQVERSAEMVRLRGPLLGQWGAVPRNNGNTANHIGVYASLIANYFANTWPTPASGPWPAPTDGHVTNYTKAYFNDTASVDMYEAYLCLKCHSYFAWGTDGVQSVTTGSGTYAQTDVTRDFNPRNLGYHPVFNHGQNRPGAANTNFNLAFNNARGIYQDSYITCTDCHNSSDATAADARGPHGSANSFILRSNETGAGITAVVFCYNCHMRDTYSDKDYKCNGNTGSAGSCLYSRQTHPPDKENGNVWAKPPNSPMPGIWCMGCHGGGRFGGLHGSNEPAAYGTTPRGYRLVNGATWSGWEAGTTATPVKCWSTSGAGVIAGYTNYSSCARSLSADSGNNANYNYPPAHSDP